MKRLGERVNGNSISPGTDAGETFQRFVARKTRDAERATVRPLVTVDDRSRTLGIRTIGNAWSKRLYDGGFHVTDLPAKLPAISLIFVESREGNTAAATGRDVFFSVRHPELVALRAELGLPRHPAQIVVSRDGQVDLDALLFNTLDVPVFLMAGAACEGRCAAGIAARP
jgi:hypothetical protein